MKKKNIKSIALISILLFVVAFMAMPIGISAQCLDVNIDGECVPSSCRCDGDEACGEFDDTAGMTCGGAEEGGTCRDEGGTIRCIRDASTDTGTTSTTAAPLQARNLPNPLGDITSIPQAIGRVINMFTGIAGSIALLMFVYGGVLWLTSGGNEERITNGKKAIVWASIGLFVIFGSYAILRVIFIALDARL